MSKLKVKLVRSPANRIRSHKATVRGLGLRRMHSTSVIEATPENLGMVRKVRYLLDVEEV
ncbi:MULTISPECIES: 50S ribosomal protein L30 [Thioalkalivibrio]|uniref:Large ribosomal subunit protein uL30 n=1 Tax=Thioalkalivibrio halophilus TaxID=252474 RepID=A0A1V2ZVY5_9GAMM|nr:MULTISPECIES: 50S ribosomal protein L30 [Thioalkalivibrio]OOC09297.1 50S ribosomal protein L30 [Thioalkalivibrio halophilus]PYG03002.1 LSU ribosomal protein L30P [Thioalkalivibrio sp. ALE21]